MMLFYFRYRDTMYTVFWYKCADDSTFRCDGDDGTRCHDTWWYLFRCCCSVVEYWWCSFWWWSVRCSVFCTVDLLMMVESDVGTSMFIRLFDDAVWYGWSRWRLFAVPFLDTMIWWLFCHCWCTMIVSHSSRLWWNRDVLLPLLSLHIVFYIFNSAIVPRHLLSWLWATWLMSVYAMVIVVGCLLITCCVMWYTIFKLYCSVWRLCIVWYWWWRVGICDFLFHFSMMAGIWLSPLEVIFCYRDDILFIRWSIFGSGMIYFLLLCH